MTILLIEDDTIHMKLIKRAIHRSGYGGEIISIEDGEKAIEFIFPEDVRARPSNPRLILLDINLPKINGIEVLRMIKGDERLKSTPVVMLTTSNNRTDMERCFRNGANSYITKPLDFDTFTAKMELVVKYWLEINDISEE